MPERVKHNSSQHDGLAQLDSVFAQIRKKAAMEGGKWELEVLKGDDGTTSLALIVETVQPPASKAAALRDAADEEDKRVAAKREELAKELAALPE